MFRSRRSVLAKRLWKFRVEPRRRRAGPAGDATLNSAATSEDIDRTSREGDEEEDGCCCGRGISGGIRGLSGQQRQGFGCDRDGIIGSQEFSVQPFPQLPRTSMVRKDDAFALFDRLGTSELELLLAVVRGGGDEPSGCIPSPVFDEDVDPSHQQLCEDVMPNVICCRLFRWPSDDDEDDDGRLRLRPMPGCAGRVTSTVCCNPYHWYQVLGGSSNAESPEDDAISLSDCSKNTSKFPDSSSQDRSSTSTFSSELSGWCNIAYWELRQRVGRQFVVRDDHVNVFGDVPLGSGLCLAQLHRSPDPNSTGVIPASVLRTRGKIGSGLVLSRETDGIWIYNRSSFPLFVGRPLTIAKPSSSSSTIDRLPPGFALRIFDGRGRGIPDDSAPTTPSNIAGISPAPDGPCNMRSVQISFAKGWGGERYSRRSITNCPCWIEVLLGVNR